MTELRLTQPKHNQGQMTSTVRRKNTSPVRDLAGSLK